MTRWDEAPEDVAVSKDGVVIAIVVTVSVVVVNIIIGFIITSNS